MKLKRLEIKKFRGLENKIFDIPQDKNVIAFIGKNGCGKSTSVDSIMFLLCDETFVYGGQNPNNIDKNNRNEALEVTAIFVKDDGTELELKRTYKPKFKKDGTFSSYSNDLYINGASYSVTEYFDRIKSEIGIKKENDPNVTSFNTLRSILDYTYLNSIDYQIARKKIEKLLNLSSDGELVNNPSYSIVKQELQAQVFDVAKTKSKLNKNKNLLEGQLKQLNAELDIIKKAYKPIDKNAYNELLSKREKVEKMVYSHSAEYQASINKIQELNTKVKEQYDIYLSAKKAYDLKVDEIKKCKYNVEFYKKTIDNLKENFISVKKTESKCPKCNYVLNGDDIKKKLDEINKEGTKTNDLIEKEKKKLESIDIDSVKKAFETESNKYFEMVNQQTEENNKLKAIIEREDKESSIFNNDKMERLRTINGEIQAILSNSNDAVLKQKLNDVELARQNMAKVEQQLTVLDSFAENKNSIIEKRINEVFPNLDFKLFKESDSGAVLNTCKVYLKNVEFEGVNTGNQIMLGFEVINSLRKVLGVTESLPIIFDNMNDLDKTNFSKLSEMNNQIISTYIQNSEEVKILAI